MSIKLMIPVAVLAVACLDADDQFDPALGESEQALCDPIPGGFEICDGQDNDCDGVADEQCAPIVIDRIRPYACLGPHGGFLAVADRSTVLVLHGLELDRVSADGTVAYDVNSNLPLQPRRIYRSASGRIFVAGQRPVVADTPTRLRVHEVSAVAGQHMSVVVDQPIPAAFNAFAVDRFNRFYFSWGEYSPNIFRLQGTQFVFHADTGYTWPPYLLAFASDDTSLFGWANDGHFWHYTPGVAPADLGSGFVATMLTGGVAVDGLGRAYLAARMTPSGLSRIYRYEPDGSGQVIFAEGLWTSRVAYDHETHELVVYSAVEAPPCAAGVAGVLRRIRL